MEKELKPCPFCGGMIEKISGLFSREIMFRCHKCGARVYFYGAGFDPKATEAWNRRYQDEQQ